MAPRRMDAHVQVLPRLRVHMLLDADGTAAAAVQEVLAIPGGLLRLYRVSGFVTSSLVLDPRVEAVAAHLTMVRHTGLAVPRVR